MIFFLNVKKKNKKYLYIDDLLYLSYDLISLD